MPNMEIIVGTQLSNVAAQTTLDIQGIVTSMKASGMSNSAIKDTLMADLTGGGRIFGNYRNQVKNTVKSGVSMAGSNASKDIFTKAGVEKFRWQTVQGDTVCPDCEPRHGQIESMKVWEMIGTPQSGFSVCQQYCQCQLIAADYKGENLDKPLVRGKKKISDITSPSLVGTHKKISDSEKWVEVNMVMAKDPGVKTKTDLSKFRNKNNTESLNEYLLSWDKARLGVKMDEVVAEIGDFGESAGVTKLVKENGIPNRMQNQRLSLFGPIWDLKPEEFIKFKDKFTKPGFNLARNIGDVATHEAGHAKLNNFLWLTRQKEPSFTKFKKTDALKVSPYARTSYQEYFSESNLARDRNLPIPSGIKKDLEKVDSFLKSKDKELLESAYEKYRDSLKLKNWENSAEIAKEWDLLASEVSKKYSL